MKAKANLLFTIFILVTVLPMIVSKKAKEESSEKFQVTLSYERKKGGNSPAKQPWYSWNVKEMSPDDRCYNSNDDICLTESGEKFLNDFSNAIAKVFRTSYKSGAYLINKPISLYDDF